METDTSLEEDWRLKRIRMVCLAAALLLMPVLAAACSVPGGVEQREAAAGDDGGQPYVMTTVGAIMPDMVS